MNGITILVGYVLDLIFGDPYSFPHPVRYIGKLIRFVEGKVRKCAKSQRALKIGGFILWFITAFTTYFLVWLLVQISKMHPIVYFVTNAFLLYTTLATKCLGDEALKIYKVLKTGDLSASRVQLSYIVGRDTAHLREEEIVRATVETVAENTVDGIIAPLFYAFIGGAPLAFLYKAINTLDSTVGYKNEKYAAIGFASAKIDDVANFIPARITAVLMMFASMVLKLEYKSSIKIAIRDRKNHKSPNCAYAEGAVAGALGIQLGGTNVYFGESIYKPTIGDKVRQIEAEDILRTNKIMYATSFIGLVIFMGIYLGISALIG